MPFSNSMGLVQRYDGYPWVSMNLCVHGYPCRLMKSVGALGTTLGPLDHFGTTSTFLIFFGMRWHSLALSVDW